MDNNQSDEGVQRIVINQCHGGFSLTQEAVEWMRERYDDIEELTTLPGEYYSDGSGPRKDRFGMFGRDLPRDHPALIEAVEELGEDANGSCADLGIIEIPEDVSWTIEEYDGAEWIAEEHRTWP